ncbi:HD domain-containing protein [Clostridium tyrobutyricum]|uniref:HD domain-containing protein n=1 Tax=Clostridium tyrobutyricum TaxID=1519 RepID=UPI001C384C14|nr:HD domain-containing protein [Clostridium tyrobutyricum]MBV4420566.1 HD domain-containing protein [Clostridium tyrobutyricum]
MTKLSGLVINKMISYFNNDVKRINHALKVYSFSKSIGELEGLDEKGMLVLEISSILHDIGIKQSKIKYNSTAGKYQELEGPPIARELLKDIKLEKDILDRICFLIGNHHSYNKIDKIDLQILVEGDFLVNAYEDKLNYDQIKTVKDKYFKTKTGKCFLDTIYKE